MCAVLGAVEGRGLGVGGGGAHDTPPLRETRTRARWAPGGVAGAQGGDLYTLLQGVGALDEDWARQVRGSAG